MIVMGLETSCDETAVGIVDAEGRILANQIASQLEEHRPYGGVVPEIAARAHLEYIDALVRAALEEADLTLNHLHGIAATCGPGLIGGVMVGAMTGKALAAVQEIPFIAVNHLEAHALTARLTHKVSFPYLLLLMSGGHCQFLIVHDVGDYTRLGGTMDDAVGECFDKSAKLLGLGYPGGPRLEQAATDGQKDAYLLPRPLVGRPGCDFSFSGLKTAVRLLVEQRSHDPYFVVNAAASLQNAIADILVDRTENAFRLVRDRNINISSLVTAGGVAANQTIRGRLKLLSEKFEVTFVAPPVALCTDNGVMVAWAGLERLRLGLSDPLDTAARPRWPLERRV